MTDSRHVYDLLTSLDTLASEADLQALGFRERLEGKIRALSDLLYARKMHDLVNKLPQRPFTEEKLEYLRSFIIPEARCRLDALGDGNVSLWDHLHPKIMSVARYRIEAGHFADAVEAALKEVNSTVKELVRGESGQELDGARLMTRAFSVENPIIMLADLATESGRSEQIGFMQIFAGAMTGIRNPKAHANVSIGDSEAVHFLYLASLLMFKLDQSSRRIVDVESLPPLGS